MLSACRLSAVRVSGWTVNIDQLTEAEEIIYTKCAHVFHFRCLTTWLERSKSCPQCREKITRNKIHRLYFTFSNNDTSDYKGLPLQEKVDNLKFQILLKEKDIQFQSSENITLKKQNTGLKQEITKLESEISQKNAAIHALKEQIKYFKEESSQCDYLKTRIAHLKSKLGELKPIQTLLQAPLSDVSKMVGNTKDPDVLTVYISIMKKELMQSFDKCKKLQITVKRLKEMLSKSNKKSDTSLEEPEKQTDLEEKLAALETKSIALQKRIDELESLLDIKRKYNDVLETDETGSQSNSSIEIPLEGDPETENQITSTKSSVTKRTTKRKADKVSVRSTKSVQEIIDTSHIEVNTSNSDLEVVSCSPSGLNTSMGSSSICLLESNSSSSNNDINYPRPQKKRKIRAKNSTTCSNDLSLMKDNTTYSNVIDLT